MAKYIIEDTTLVNIADAIRSNSETNEMMTPSEMAENISKVKEAGVKSEYDRFWDTFQQNGNRTVYMSSFGCGWDGTLFNPKYSMRPTNASRMFFNNMGQSIYIEDLVEFLKERNIELDFSNCGGADYGLSTLNTNHFGVLDFRKCTTGNSLSDLFYSHDGNWKKYKVKIIDEFISSLDTFFNNNTFKGCAYLESIKMSGEIGKNINFQWSTLLDKPSITSIINCLSSATSNLTCSFSKTAKENAFTAEEWATLIATKPNWTISLV